MRAVFAEITRRLLLLRRAKTMKIRSAAISAMALAAALCVSQMLIAQGPPPPGANDRYDERAWTSPRSYNGFQPENQRPNMIVQQGYAAGFSQGESDFRDGRRFRPTKAGTYKNVPDSPKDINRNEFKQIYRDAFEEGYSRAYGR